MQVEELNNQSEWESFLQASSGATIYHSPQWREVIRRSFPALSPLYLAIRKADQKLIGMFPGFVMSLGNIKMYHSTPYSDYGGPVIAEHFVEQGSSSLLSFLHDFCSKNGIAYAKICFLDDRSMRSFHSRIAHTESTTGVMDINLEATPSRDIWNRVFSARMRKKIRLIDRDGFQTEEAKTRSDLKDFYALYTKNMKCIGASPFEYDFMKNIWDVLYPKNLRILMIGKNRRIGGIAILKYGKSTYWVYVGIDRRYSDKYSIIPYLVWQEIKKAEGEGYRHVSLGSTSCNPMDVHYLQKMSLGASFHRQETVWYPFDCRGRILLLTRSKIVGTWKATRSLLPSDFRLGLEKVLSTL